MDKRLQTTIDDIEQVDHKYAETEHNLLFKVELNTEPKGKEGIELQTDLMICKRI